MLYYKVCPIKSKDIFLENGGAFSDLYIYSLVFQLSTITFFFWLCCFKCIDFSELLMSLDTHIVIKQRKTKTKQKILIKYLHVFDKILQFKLFQNPEGSPEHHTQRVAVIY